MKYGFKSYNSWDPLKKCMVGNVYEPNFFSVYPDARVGDALEKVNEETRGDIAGLKSVLESAGVEVIQTPNEVVTGDGTVIKDVNQHVEKFGTITK